MAQAEKMRLDIPVVLPGVEDARDRCVERLIASLSGRDGISEVHVTAAGGVQSPQLCIHYEPHTISLQRVRELAASSGAALGERFAHLAFQTSTQHARAARRLGDQISELKGVVEAEVATTGSVRIEFDRSLVTEATVRSELGKLGLQVEPAGARPVEWAQDARSHGGRDAHAHSQNEHAGEHEHEGHDHGGHDHDHGGIFGEKSELIFALLAGLMVLIGWLLSWRDLAPESVTKGFYMAAYVFGGYFTLKEARLTTLKLQPPAYSLGIAAEINSCAAMRAVRDYLYTASVDNLSRPRGPWRPEGDAREVQSAGRRQEPHHPPCWRIAEPATARCQRQSRPHARPRASPSRCRGST